MAVPGRIEKIAAADLDFAGLEVDRLGAHITLGRIKLAADTKIGREAMGIHAVGVELAGLGTLGSGVAAKGDIDMYPADTFKVDLGPVVIILFSRMDLPAAFPARRDAEAAHQ